MSCPACGNAFRKGTTVLLLEPNAPRRARVCSSCARRGLLVVSPVLAPVVKATREVESIVPEAIRQLRAYARASEAHVKGTAGPGRGGVDRSPNAKAHFTGRAEAFEGAIQLLQSLSKAGA
jgi:hypothetical protein